MKVGFLFPGQGSQSVGMGKDLWTKYDIVKEIYQSANEVLGFDIREISFHGPEKELRKTNNAQVAIVVHSLAVHAILKENGIHPIISAGHSLGEYSAIITAKGLSFEDGLRLVKLRGELMSEAGNSFPGGMIAILGLSLAEVENLCQELSGPGTIVVANINAPNQIVLSGEVEIIKSAAQLAVGAGATKVVTLPVSAAFHSPLMDQAAQKFKEALQKTEFHGLERPIIGNVSACYIDKKEDLIHELELQILSPVRWLESITRMSELGVERFVEVGPGNVLKGLLLNINRRADVLSTGEMSKLSRALEDLAKWNER